MTPLDMLLIGAGGLAAGNARFAALQHSNALKNLLSAVIYSVTIVTFVIAGAVSWPHTLLMVLTASLGGYWGARMARGIRGPWLRRMVIIVGCALTAYYFYKMLG